jgi:ubiquitin-conjugating enzyme E2 variant
MPTTFLILRRIIATVLLADFGAGFFHWLEDAYASEDTPVIGPTIAHDNILHHHCPRAFTKFSWWHSAKELILFSALLVLGAWALGMLTWEVWLFAMLTANANEVHKWSHRTRAENGRFISWLQDIHLLQTPRHHARHHTDPKNSHYCTTTNLLNPVLDGIHFWAGLEQVLFACTGLKRREDSSVAGHGPAPEWIEKYRRATKRPTTAAVVPARLNA